MSAPKDQLIYDDGCGLCQRGVWLLKQFDWFKTITLVPLSNAADLLVEHSITTEAMMKAMHLVTR
ncbi:MAG: DCC1-like thiol-disulfide oxidoreductase family protein, partial [Acidimicrobiales bacterium]|nr:DCC1-like thiol-disulfide oxidoreductase family protein [Acidimicrobiales bacterium]